MEKMPYTGFPSPKSQPFVTSLRQDAPTQNKTPDRSNHDLLKKQRGTNDEL